MRKEQKVVLKKFLLIGLCVILGLLVIACAIVVLMIKGCPSQWEKDIALIKKLSPSPILFNVKYPSSDIYGYKYIRFDSSGVNDSLLTTKITISVINRNANAISVVSKGFFSGDLYPDKEAMIFQGTIEEMEKYYYSKGSPYINHKSNDRKITIKISSNKPVSFSKPIHLYMFADADFTL